jgi:hypothetical protein
MNSTGDGFLMDEPPARRAFIDSDTMWESILNGTYKNVSSRVASTQEINSESRPDTKG